jgi:hypothetical protein
MKAEAQVGCLSCRWGAGGGFSLFGLLVGCGVEGDGSLFVQARGGGVEGYSFILPRRGGEDCFSVAMMILGMLDWFGSSKILARINADVDDSGKIHVIGIVF